MATRLDHSRARRLERIARGLREYPQDETMEIDTGRPGSRPLGWRTQWDGEPFPVTVTRLDARESDMATQDDEIRPIDGNGHMPEDPGDFGGASALGATLAPLGEVLTMLAER